MSLVIQLMKIILIYIICKHVYVYDTQHILYIIYIVFTYDTAYKYTI